MLIPVLGGAAVFTPRGVAVLALTAIGVMLVAAVAVDPRGFEREPELVVISLVVLIAGHELRLRPYSR